MAKIIKTLRNNWKKSVCFSIVGAYGVNYGIEKYKERELMRSFCKEALAYGEMTQSLANKPYHVTVILNKKCGHLASLDRQFVYTFVFLYLYL